MSRATGTGDPEWANHVIKTLRLRYDALTTGELGLYEELMKTRGIEVPEWFKRIRMYVDAERPVYPAMIPTEWYELTRTSVLAQRDDWKEVNCKDCQLPTLVDVEAFSPYRCATCDEIMRIRNKLAPQIMEYDQAVFNAKLHLRLPSLRVNPLGWYVMWVLFVTAVSLVLGIIGHVA